MKKSKLILAGLGVMGMMALSGCAERVPTQQASLRNTLANVCVEHGCCTSEKADKIQPFMERFEREWQDMHDARGLSRRPFMGGINGATELAADRDRIRAGIISDFRELHAPSEGASPSQ